METVGEGSYFFSKQFRAGSKISFFRLYCSVDIGNPSSFYIFDDSILLLGLYPPINWLQCLFCQSREYGPRPLLYMIGAGLPVTYNYMGIQVGLAIMSVRCNGRKHYSSHHRPPWPRRHPCCPCSSLTSLSFPSRSRQPNLVHRHSLLPNHTIVCPTLSSLTAPQFPSHTRHPDLTHYLSRLPDPTLPSSAPVAPSFLPPGPQHCARATPISSVIVGLSRPHNHARTSPTPPAVVRPNLTFFDGAIILIVHVSPQYNETD